MASPDGVLDKKKSAVKFGYADLLKIRVGKDDNVQEFAIHESVFCARSEFFRRAMSGRWLESKDRVVNFPEDEPEIWELYINLVYTNLIVTKSEEGATDTDLDMTSVSDTFEEDQYGAPAMLYILAQKLVDIQAQNSVIEAIIDSSKIVDKDGMWKAPGASVVAYLYEETLEGSPIRRLMVDLWRSVQQEYITECFEILPKEFFHDLLIVTHCLRTVFNFAVDRGIEHYRVEG